MPTAAHFELPPPPPSGALELATLLSFATRIEPELIRAVRLDLLPHLTAADEADLWFCDWIGARSAEAVALLPECLPSLRAALVARLEGEPGLRKVEEIVTRLHSGLSPALALEERITWACLTGDPAAADRYLGRALHALVREGRTGLADWFAGAWERLPEEVRSSGGAWAFANAVRPHGPRLEPGSGSDVDLAVVAAIADAVGETGLGVLREGGRLWLGPPRGRAAAAILVPDTHPRVVEVGWDGRTRTVRLADGEERSLSVGPGPVTLRTGAGRVYEIGPAASSTAPEASASGEHPVPEITAVLDRVQEHGMSQDAGRVLTRTLREALDAFERDDDFGALRQAYTTAGDLAAIVSDSDFYTELFLTIAEVFSVYGRRTATRRALDQAVALGEPRIGRGGRTDTWARTVVGAAAHGRFLQSGRPRHLADALEILADGVDGDLAAAVAGEPGAGRLVGELLDVCLSLHECHPQPALLRRATQLGEHALSRRPLPWPSVELPLARVLVALHTVDPEAGVLDRAERLLSARSEDGHPSRRAEWEAVRSSVEVAHFWDGAHPDSLERALARSRSAVRLVPVDNRFPRARLRLALSGLLHLRHAVHAVDAGAKTIDEAVTLAERCLNTLPERSVLRQPALLALARCLVARFRTRGSQTDLERATAVAEDAVTHALEVRGDQPDRTARWGALGPLVVAPPVRVHEGRALLGECWALQFEHNTRPEALDRAVGCFRAALEELPANASSEWGVRLAEEYASALLVEEITGSRTALLDQALTVLDAPYDESLWEPTETSGRPRFELLAAAHVLARRPVMKGIRRAGHAAAVLREVAQTPGLGLLSRFRAAMAWSDLAIRLQDSEQVMRSHELIFGELFLAFTLPAAGGPPRLLEGFEERCREAAAYAIESGRPQRALVFLEQRSAVIGAWHGDQHVEMARLEAASPRLAAEVAQLWTIADLAPGHVGQPGSRNRGRSRLDAVIATVRGLPGFEGFLRPVPDAVLSHAAAEGPLVVLNAARRRCDALLLTRNGTVVVPLPDVGLEKVTARAERYRQAYGGTRETQDRIRLDLDWLWHTTVRPVLVALGLYEYGRAPDDSHTRLPRFPSSEILPRLWWCPTGAFAGLPLHLAGGGGESTTDHVVSSYTPDIRALLNARHDERHSRHRDGPPRMLVVTGNDADPGHGSREAERVARTVPRSLLVQGSARVNLPQLLSEHSFLHVVGHAGDHLDHSGSLAILGSEHRRTTSFPHVLEAALVYLSIDGPGNDLWSVAARLQATGCRHVIAVLGPLPDDLAGRVAHEFYRQLAGPDGELRPDHAALALHQVVRDLGADVPSDRPFLGIVHLGP
ncbi:CHAT domain-containing protein [Streptomyces sp. B21-097]|uniref:CHAT domain-containing protein n=1 Tax=Streptomyces sp. B21-097 TaxID=3039414 RepID=UPI002FEF8773